MGEVLCTIVLFVVGITVPLFIILTICQYLDYAFSIIKKCKTEEEYSYGYANFETFLKVYNSLTDLKADIDCIDYISNNCYKVADLGRIALSSSKIVIDKEYMILDFISYHKYLMFLHTEWKKLSGYKLSKPNKVDWKEKVKDN